MPIQVHSLNNVGFKITQRATQLCHLPNCGSF